MRWRRASSKKSGRRRSCEKDFVSKKSSEYQVCLILAMVRASGQGTWVMGSVAPVFVSESACSFLGKSNMTGDPLEALELHGRRGSWKYPKRTLVGEMLGPWREG